MKDTATKSATSQICKTLCARYHGGWHTRHQKQTIFINNKSKFTLNNCTITFDILRNEGTRYLSRQGVTVFQICTSIYISLLTFVLSKINISHSARAERQIAVNHSLQMTNSIAGAERQILVNHTFCFTNEIASAERHSKFLQVAPTALKFEFIVFIKNSLPL
jgi:hypothetical protein